MTSPGVLYIHSSPLIDLRNKPYVTDVDILNCSSEKTIISDAIRESNLDIHFRSIIATVQNLSDAIVADATMIHYAGHGERSAISFETKYAEIYAMDVKTLRSLLEASQTSSRTKIVVVSACHSEEAGRTFIEAGIPHVIAVKREHRLADKTSLIFTKSFYNALLLGKSVQTAFDIAVSTVSAIHGSNRGEEFVLLPLNGSHAECVFENVSKSNQTVSQEKFRSQTINYCDCPPSNFIERGRIMQELFRHFVDSHRCVTLHGPRGCGKSAIALRTASFIAERNLFDFIFFVPFERTYLDLKSKKKKEMEIKRIKNLTNDQNIQNVSDDVINDRNVIVEIIAVSMREYGDGIGSLDRLLDFLITPSAKRILFIFDGCEVFLSKFLTVSSGVISTPKLLTYKSVLQNNTNSISNNNSSNGSANNSSRTPNSSENSVELNHNASPVFRDIIDSMLRRSENVSFLNVITHKDSFLGLLSQEHENTVTLPPFNDNDSAEFLVKLSSPKSLKLSNNNSSLALFSQMQFLNCLEGNPRAIGIFAIFLNNCYNTNSKHFPLRDSEFWINSAIEIYKKVLSDGNDTDDKEEERKHKSEKYERKSEKINDREREKEKEKEKEKNYDFSATPGFEMKSNNNNKSKINFGLFSSQLPSANENICSGLHGSISFLSSPPLPRPPSSVCLNRSHLVAKSFLSSIISTSSSSSILNSDDLNSHISMWAELTANRDPPHTPRTYVEWHDFIIKLEQLLIQAIYSPNQKENKVNVSSSKSESLKNRGSNENEKFRNNYRRKFTHSDIQFLKQKIANQLSPDRIITKENNTQLCNTPHISFPATSTEQLSPTLSELFISNSSSVSQGISDNTKNGQNNAPWNDRSKVLSLSGFKEFLSWWLPLLISLRKIKKEFCSVPCVHASSGEGSCTLILGFLDRTNAVRLLETVQSPGVFLLRFSESKPGQIVISYTDKIITEMEKSEFNTSNHESSPTHSERIMKSTVGHCLVDIEEKSFILRLSNNVRKYDSLKNLLMDCKKLKFFYPSFPKATAFEYLDNP